MPDLDEVRARISAIDDEVVRLAAERLALVARVAQAKRAAGAPIRDRAREREVLARARDVAARFGLPPRVAESIVGALIRSSLVSQERDRVVHAARGAGRRALVIGGAGRMGRWMSAFLLSQGYAVTVADPAGAPDGCAHVADWTAIRPDHDLVVVAAPLAASAGILRDLARARPPGVVFDVGSLKGPLASGIRALAAAGAKVTSVHPMFGPDTDLLSGRHVILVDAGVPEATAEARALFEPTMATLVEMGLDEHDRLIGWVLGLSHAVAISFFAALAGSGEPASRLARLSSTTFQAQIEVSRRVASENPHLYYEIQRMNPHGLAPLRALADAVAALLGDVSGGDERSFVTRMEQGRAWLEDLP
ncbi:MAG: prephenate dehydrogenase/arogenate dehydrogenase family protein [Deltaproteobacteria bacterium]|nr:prephenate dehydrogenase/arogenate dehydrogenase family protein [Deltaproteobacteria bacterium]